MSFSAQVAALGAGYLLWYGWRVFVREKGNPGGIGMTLSVMAWMTILHWLIFD